MKLVVACLLLATPAAADDGISLGARISPQWLFLEGDGPPADLSGYTVGLDVAVPVTSRIAIAGSVATALYTQRSDRLPPGGNAYDIDGFAELLLDTSPDGPWTARIAIGTGVRTVTVPLAAGPTDRFRAWEALRLRVGPAWKATPHVEVGLDLGIGFGLVFSRDRSGVCAVDASCADSLYDSDTQSAAQIFADLGVFVRTRL